MFQNTLGVARKFGSTAAAKAAAVGGALTLAAGRVLAEVPADAQKGLTDMKVDGLTVAGLVLAAVIAVFAIKFVRKGL